MISSIAKLSNHEATLVWDAPPGQPYLLEASPDLVNWDGPVTGGEIIVENHSTLIFQPPAGDKLFHRIIPAAP